MKALTILSLTGALALAGCGAFQEQAPRANAATSPDEVTAGAVDSGSLEADGVAYAVGYKSHGLWRDAEGSAGTDTGVPQITVARADGTALTNDEYVAARGVAKAYCAQHPEFRRDVVFGDAAVIEGGTFVFSEICD